MLEHLQILVADDAPAMRFALVGLLRRAGACVDQAVSGREVLLQASEKHYDLVLLDVEMPEMDGLETASRLRHAGFSNPIVALCGNSEAQREACLAAGMDEVLPKPCPSQMLLDHLRSLCGDKSPRHAGIAAHHFSFPSFRDFCGSDEAFMKRLLAIASEALPATACGLRDAIAKADALKIGELAHRARPSVEGLGLNGLAAMLRELERLVQAAGSANDVAALALEAAAALDCAAERIRTAG